MDPLHIAVLETLSELGEASFWDLLTQRLYIHIDAVYELKGIPAPVSLMIYARKCLLSFGDIQNTYRSKLYPTYTLTIKGKAFLLQRKLEESAREEEDKTT